MRSCSLKFCRHFVLGFSFIVTAAASGARGSDRLPPPGKGASASQAGQVAICHLAQSTQKYNAILVSPSSVTLARHLRHGDCRIDDNIACTTDSCHATLGCVHAPNNSLCDDGLFCTTEHCEPAVGCVAVSTCPPFTDGCVIRNDSCDESGGTCVDLAVDAACDDGNECTTDTCDLALDCQYAALSDLASCTGGICCAEVCVSCADDCCCADAQCASPDTCGGGGTPNVCGCTPTTCAAEGADCGNISDDCGGTLNCGTCAAFCSPGNTSDLSSDGCPCTSNLECEGVCPVADDPSERICQDGSTRLDCAPGNGFDFSIDGCPCTSNLECEGVCPIADDPSERICQGGSTRLDCAPGNGFDFSIDGCPCTSNNECEGVCVNGVCTN